MVLILVFLVLFVLFTIVQSIRAWLWKDKYDTLVQSLKLGESDGTDAGNDTESSQNTKES